MSAQKTQEVDPNTEMFVARMKYFMEHFNKISNHCFDVCVHDFTTRKTMPAEWSCAENCLQKYFKSTQRISQRFDEAMQTMQPSKVGGS